MSYSYSTSGDPVAALIVLIITIAIIVLFVVAYFMSISTLAKIVSEKGTRVSKGKAWFLGLFTTPITLALIVIADVTASKGERP
jgi:hypothetical protein